jgi:DNA end-binding protein Ku
VPLLYFDHPYYLAPGKGGDKVYALLRETLKKTGKIGIARVVIRVKQHLAALVCVGDTIVMNTLRYADEIRDAGDLKIPDAHAKGATITDKELKMAMALVEGMSEDWHPEQYHDTYREDVLALVEKKVAANETKSITMPGKEERPAAASNVIDLVSLLQASLGKKPGKEAVAAEDEEEEEAPAPKPRKAAAKTPAKSGAHHTAAANEDKPQKRAAAAKTPSTSKTSAPAKAPARRNKAA